MGNFGFWRVIGSITWVRRPPSPDSQSPPHARRNPRPTHTENHGARETGFLRLWPQPLAPNPRNPVSGAGVACSTPGFGALAGRGWDDTAGRGGYGLRLDDRYTSSWGIALPKSEQVWSLERYIPSAEQVHHAQ